MFAQVFTQWDGGERGLGRAWLLSPVKEGVGQNTAAPLPRLIAGWGGSRKQWTHGPAGVFIPSYPLLSLPA